MAERRLHILQVGTYDQCGGAERVAWNLFEAYQDLGHQSWLAVGRKRTRHPRVVNIPNHRTFNPWSALWWLLYQQQQAQYAVSHRARFICRWSHRLASPAGWFDTLRGIEDFHYPGTKRLWKATPARPDLLHAHNLHGPYFDLSALPKLCQEVPVVLTLHDAWLLSGHCAHSFDCGRWRSGCGACPDLTIHPPIRRDATAFNWRRKRNILARCRLHVATPCQWLMSRVQNSILAPGIIDARVIPNGIDLSIFQPADRRAIRHQLNLPVDAAILLFAGYGVRKNAWKDYGTMQEAVARLAKTPLDRPLLFLALGETGPTEHIGSAQIRFVPFEADPAVVARYYQAADLYLHAARADTFPNTVLEALACGTPVVATATGGIPEQIRSLPSPSDEGDHSSSPHSAEPTGVLVPQADAGAMAEAIKHLLVNPDLRQRMGQAAATDAQLRFDLRRQVSAYLSWYDQILAAFC